MDNNELKKKILELKKENEQEQERIRLENELYELEHPILSRYTLKKITKNLFK